MANIIIVDDRSTGDELTRMLKQDGHDVELVKKNHVNEFFEAIAVLLEKDVEKCWDFLILDIHFVSHKYGGVELFELLDLQGLTSRWKNTIILTRYAEAGIQMESGRPRDYPNDWQKVLDFADKYGIPQERIVYPQGGMFWTKVTEIITSG